MKTHMMKLRTKYFDYIQTGNKRIELRLNDEKRKDIKVGDKIIFEELVDNPRYIETKVIDLFYSDNFNNIINKFNIELLADKSSNKEELLSVLNDIYTIENQSKYGVIGIKKNYWGNKI